MKSPSTRILWIALAVLAVAGPAAADGITAPAAFDQLKGLAGTWTGDAEGEGAEAEAEAAAVGDGVVHEIEVSAAGTVVMETMGPGTPYEMINVYHLDGDDLVMTHYCAGGNQPRMRLDREASTATRLVFDYTGGTNHDPAVDPHIHSAEIEWIGENRIDSNWQSWVAGEPADKMQFRLSRGEG